MALRAQESDAPSESTWGQLWGEASARERASKLKAWLLDAPWAVWSGASGLQSALLLGALELQWGAPSDLWVARWGVR